MLPEHTLANAHTWAPRPPVPLSTSLDTVPSAGSGLSRRPSAAGGDSHPIAGERQHEQETSRGRLRAVTTVCPYRKQVVVELWAGVEPMLPANLYLRHLLDERSAERGTLKSKASRLKSYFAFLRARGHSFWHPDARLGGNDVQAFKETLLQRATAKEITFGRVNDILGDVLELCRYFVQPGEQIPGEYVSRVVESRGGTPATRLHVERPLNFQVKVPAEERNRTNRVMTPADVERIWELFGPESEPVPDDDIVRNTRPRSEWSAQRRRRWDTARASYASERAKHRRRRMLWSQLIGGGWRKEELPLLMNRDVTEHRSPKTARPRVWVSLRVRKEHENLGRAKTGERLVYLGGDARHQDALEGWRESRGILVVDWMRRTGQPDHEMFLTNDDGAPLTGDGVEYLCDWISDRVGPVGDEGYGAGGFKLHPHSCRHTMRALHKRAKVHPDITQRQMGHKHQSTTVGYGKDYMDDIAEGVDAMEQFFRRATEDAP